MAIGDSNTQLRQQFIDRAILNPAKPIAGLPEDRLLTVGATDWLERGSLNGPVVIEYSSE